MSGATKQTRIFKVHEPSAILFLFSSESKIFMSLYYPVSVLKDFPTSKTLGFPM